MLDNEPSWGEVRKRSLLRNSLYALGIAVCALVAIPALAPTVVAPAEAAFAPSGNGLYKGTIDWMEWGTAGELIPAAGKTVSSTRVIADQSLMTSCTLTPMSGQVAAYRSGTWRGDALDDLYNRGGPNENNTLVYGIANRVDKEQVNFKVTCSATLGPKDGTAPAKEVNLSGLVIADAESSNTTTGTNGQTEFISAKPGQPSTWHIIERSRSDGCTTNGLADLAAAADNTLKLYSAGAQCSSTTGPNGPNGPMAVAYMASSVPAASTSATVTVKGEGTGAVAIGAVLQADFGDAPNGNAPNGYGEAGALFQRQWVGGTLNAGSTRQNLFDTNFVLGQPGQPIPRLGASTDADVQYQGSVDAKGDDMTGIALIGGNIINDEDAIPPQVTPLRVVPGEPYTFNNVACTGPGSVAGWLDWNLNGTFDAGEKSAVAACTGTSVNLSWNVPADVKNTPGQTKSFLRLRIAADAVGVASPIGLSTSGEVEDHAVRISTSNLSLQKNIKARVAPTDQFTLSVTPAGGVPESVSTSGSTTGVQAAIVGPMTATKNRVYTLKEVATGSPLTPLSEYNTELQCTGTYADGSIAPAISIVHVAQGEATITMPEPSPTLGAQSVVCTFTNTPKPATLNVSKLWKVNGTTYANGDPKLAGINAQLTLGGINQDWGKSIAGYSAGAKVTINETMNIAATMPGCTVKSQQVTNSNGAGINSVVPYALTLKAGANTATVTNTVTCNTNLTLLKEVRGGSAQPSDWMLSAYPSSGPAVVQGVSGSGPVTNANVTAGVQLQLGESGGSALYVQDDKRTEDEKTNAPRSTGSWACRAAVGGQNISVTGRMGTDGTITPTLGSKVTCEATNRTAELTILKKVENVNGTGTGKPENWNVTATPAGGVSGLVAVTKPGSDTRTGQNTFNVRPGHRYTLSENGPLGGYFQTKMEHFTGDDPTSASQIGSDANWTLVETPTISVKAGEPAIYRFVNRDAKRFDLPLTGGSGTSFFLWTGGFSVILALGAAVVISSRRKTPQKLQ